MSLISNDARGLKEERLIQYTMFSWYINRDHLIWLNVWRKGNKCLSGTFLNCGFSTHWFESLWMPKPTAGERAQGPTRVDQKWLPVPSMRLLMPSDAFWCPLRLHVASRRPSQAIYRFFFGGGWTLMDFITHGIWYPWQVLQWLSCRYWGPIVL